MAHLFLVLILVLISACQPKPETKPARKPFHEIKQQWWTKDCLISEVLEEERGVVPFPKHKLWLMKEDLKSYAATYLQTPEETECISFKNGVAWAFSAPSFYVQTSSTSLGPRKGPRKGRLYRCDDFQTWNPVATMTLSENVYVNFCEALDGNKFLLKGRFIDTPGPHFEYVVAAMDEKGELEIRPSDLLSVWKLCRIPESQYTIPFFNDVARTDDFIIHTARERGWNLIFDGHTGAFLRLAKCYDGFEEEDQARQQTSQKVQLGLRPMADGTFVLARRDESGVRVIQALRKPPVGTGAAFMPPGQFHELEDAAVRKAPQVVWAVLDAASGEMKPVNAPAGGKVRLESYLDNMFFSICYGPDGKLRTVDEATAQK